MTKRRLSAVMATSLALLVLSTSLATTASAAPVFSDDFNDNTLDTDFWSSGVGGSGPQIEEVNGRVEIFFPAGSANAPGAGIFGASYTSRCNLRGDFDIQVDYDTPVWPSGNGVRVGLATRAVSQSLPDVGERVSFGV